MRISTVDSSIHPQQSGSTVLVLMTLLGIMVMLAAANSRALIHLRLDIKLVENRQIARLNASQTNAVTAVKRPARWNQSAHRR